MTLKNARRRFEDMGCEVDKDVHPYKYKWRRIGTLAWNRGTCLELMLKQAAAIAAKVKHDADRMGN